MANSIIKTIEKKNTINPNKSKGKKVITPLQKLKKRITNEIPKKNLLGDININDDEYKLLVEYFKTRFLALEFEPSNRINDILFAVALVQIGIHKYDGKLWFHVQDVLGNKLTPIDNKKIGNSFVYTLKMNNKYIYDESEIVKSILFHGFVSDYYTKGLFEFLFHYYRIDLERDIERNVPENMLALMDTIHYRSQLSDGESTPDGIGRTYVLRKHTLDAITAFPVPGRVKMRRILRLIDKCFWLQQTPLNPSSRLTKRFIEWQKVSEAFKTERSYATDGNGGGKKSFISPYLHCNFKTNKFSLIIPRQLIKRDCEDLSWVISTDDGKFELPVRLYQAVTGYKTEEEVITLRKEDIFGEIKVELIGNELIRKFKIPSDSVRFFDKDGDYSKGIFVGEMFAFTQPDDTIISDALVDNEPVGSLVRSYFDFEDGDIVILPDKKPLIVGEKYSEGLMMRNHVKGVYAISNEDEFDIYSSHPSLLLILPEKRANGTCIEINSKRIKLFDNRTNMFDIKDGTGNKGYLLNLADWGVNADGIYNIIVDVPNERKFRQWNFSIMQGFNYCFEDAPYIFEQRGTIRFNNGLNVISKSIGVKKNTDSNSYNFDIKADEDEIIFALQICNVEIAMHFNIPTLKWKFGNGDWHIEKPTDIWHSDFPTLISFKYTDDKLIISVDDDHINDDESEQSIIFHKIKSKGVFECDVTRVQSWFNREKGFVSVHLELPTKKVELVKVFTRSVVLSHLIKGDFQKGILIGEFDIVGYANYYADVVLKETKEQITDKLPIENGRFEVLCSLASGKYEISLFEDEEDDTGFGISNYLPISEYVQDLINPFDLYEKSIKIRNIKKGADSVFSMMLNFQYIICDLKRIDENDRNNYSGRMVVKNLNDYGLVALNVNVEFFDLNKLQMCYIQFDEENEWIEFLYDSKRKTIVKNEESGLPKSERYRRYEPLYPEDYVYVVEFTDIHVNAEVPPVKSESKPNNKELSTIVWKDGASKNSKSKVTSTQNNKVDGENSDVLIEQMGLSSRSYNCLKRAKLYSVSQIIKVGPINLSRVRNLGRKGYQEVVNKIQKFGMQIPEFFDDDILKTENNQPKNYDETQNNIKIVSLLEQSAFTDVLDTTVEKNQPKKCDETLDSIKTMLLLEQSEFKDVLDTTVENIGLSMRVMNCLKKSRIQTVGEIVNITNRSGIKGINNIRGINKDMGQEVINALYSLGIRLT